MNNDAFESVVADTMDAIGGHTEQHRWAVRRKLQTLIQVAQLRGHADATGVGFFRLLAEEPGRVAQVLDMGPIQASVTLVDYGRE